MMRHTPRGAGRAITAMILAAAGWTLALGATISTSAQEPAPAQPPATQQAPAAQQPSATTAPAVAIDTSDKDAALFLRMCSTCHDSARVLGNRRTRTQWEEVIQKMVERGAQGTEDEFATVHEFLLRVSGMVNVNRGAATDIAAVTHLTEKDADAIVAYRKANGDFADFDALCKVPGIDVEKLKLARDAVSF